MKTKFNIGNKALSDADIERYKDFDAVYAAYLSKKSSTPKVNWWVVSTATAAAAMLIFVMYFSFFYKTTEVQSPTTLSTELAMDLTLLPVSVSPPVAAMDVPRESYRINASTGGKLTTSSGTEIIIPARAFADESGTIVQGEVDVKYREFDNPLEFFLAGIPNQQAVAGTLTGIESAGMFEILAFSENQPLILNKDKFIQVDMVSAFPGTFSSLFFDPSNSHWDKFGSTELLTSVEKSPAPAVQALLPVDTSDLPLKPRRSDRKNVFNVPVDVSAFPELAAYKGLLFKVNDEVSRIDENVTRIQWYSARLKKSNLEGNYDLTLTIRDTSLTVMVYPVFEKKNYEEAMRIYQERKQAWLALQQENQQNLRKEARNDQIVNGALTTDNSASAPNFRDEKKVGKRRLKVGKLGIYQCGQALAAEGMMVLQPLINSVEGREMKDLRFFVSERKRNTLLSFGRSTVISYRANTENIVWAMDAKGNIGIIDPTDFANATASNLTPNFVVDFRPPEKGVAALRKMLLI